MAELSIFDTREMAELSIFALYSGTQGETDSHLKTVGYSLDFRQAEIREGCELCQGQDRRADMGAGGECSLICLSVCM